MAKNRTPTIRDHPMKFMEEHLRRKAMRQRPQRDHPKDEPIFPLGSTGYTTEPQIQVIAIPLTGRSIAMQSGLTHQGDDPTNFPSTRSEAGVEGGDCLRVDAELEGLHKQGVAQLMPNDTGGFSVRVGGLGSASGEDYEYVLSVHQSDGAATPASEESLVIRWEYDDSATPTHYLRLYPDLTNYPGTYVEIELDEATWQATEWHQIRASWSYQDQEWRLWWDDTEGTFVQPATPDIIPWPEWDPTTCIELFTDHVGANVIYHDVQFAAFGVIPPTANLWETIVSDDGETTANIPRDTLNILGARGNTTSIVDDTLTITAPAGIVFYFDDEDDPFIAGYKRWRRAIPAGLEATAVQTGKNTDGEMLLGSWVTSFGSPGLEVIPAGEWNWHCYAHVDNATNESYIKFYVYKRNLAGAETALFNVTTADINDLAVALQHFIYAQADPIALLTTDRLVVKAYFYTTRPADVTMTFTYDGAVHASHVHTPFYSYAGLGLGSISHCVNYDVIHAADTVNVLALRAWQDETVLPVSYLLQPEVPRTIAVAVVPAIPGVTLMNGTVIIYGFDANGFTVREVIIVNTLVGMTYETSMAFGELTSIVVDQIDANLLSTYSVGLGRKVGLPNYPFNVAGDVYKFTMTSAGFIPVPTVDPIHGTVDLVVPLPGPLLVETYVFWYRPFR